VIKKEKILHTFLVSVSIISEKGCGNLPQCKADKSHHIANAGDIYTLQVAAWPLGHPHKLS
jgi:hypothetical protein